MQVNNTSAAFAVRLGQRYGASLIPILNKRYEDSRIITKFCSPVTALKGENVTYEALLAMDQLMTAWVTDNLEQWYMLHELRL